MEDYSKWKVMGNKRVGAKRRKNGRLLQVESNREASQLGEKLENRKNPPTSTKIQLKHVGGLDIIKPYMEKEASLWRK